MAAKEEMLNAMGSALGFGTQGLEDPMVSAMGERARTAERSKLYEKSLTEDVFTDTHEGSTLLKLLDFVNRGQYALVAGIEAAEQAPTAENIFGAVKAGLSGDVKRSWIDYFEPVLPDHPYLRTIGGLTGDILLDPINLTPAALPRTLGKLLKLPELVNAARKISRIDRVMESLGDLSVVNKTMQAFKPGWDLRKIPGAYDQWRDLTLKLNFIRRNVLNELRLNSDEFRKICKKLDIDPDIAAADMIKLREFGEADEIPEMLQPLYDHVVNGLEKIKNMEIQAGILNPKKVVENYFPHIYERGEFVWKGGKMISTRRKGGATKLGFRGQIFAQKRREFKTLEEAKQQIKLWQDRGIATDLVPVENWFRGYALRRFVSESALTWRRYIDDTLKQFGTPLRDVIEQQLGVDFGKVIADLSEKGTKSEFADMLIELQKGNALVTATSNLRAPATRELIGKEIKRAALEGNEEELLTKIFKKTEGRGVIDVGLEELATLRGEGIYLLPEELSGQIKRTFKVFATDEGTKGLLRAYDAGLHIWKSMATSLRLPFHIRNATSNTWLMYLAGVEGHMIGPRILDAVAVQTGAKGFAGFTAKEIMDIADRYGVRAYGWQASDVPRMFHDQAYRAAHLSKLERVTGIGPHGVNPLAAAGRAGRTFGTYIEDNARLATFLDQMQKLGIKKGMSEADMTAKLQEASKTVRKYLFDYTELTDAERNVMKRLIPFYTWSRKNIPLMFETIMTQPHKYARLGDFENALWPDAAQTQEDKFLVPPWMKEMGYKKMPEKWPHIIPTDWVDDAGNRVFYHVDIPPDDLNRMFSMSNWVNSMTPAKTMLEIFTNVRVWPKPGKIATPGTRVVAPFWVAWLPESMHRIMDIGPTIDQKGGRVTLGMSPRWLYGIKTALPFLADWDRMYPTAGRLAVHEKMDKFAALSYATGIKFKPLDKNEQARSLLWRYQEAIQNVRKSAKSTAGFQGMSSEEAQQRALEVFKRSMNE